MKFSRVLKIVKRTIRRGKPKFHTSGINKDCFVRPTLNSSKRGRDTFDSSRQSEDKSY